LDPACFDEKVTLFEIHRASINSYFCNNIGRNEDRDVARFEQRHREYEEAALDEIQVYRDLQAIEDHRRISSHRRACRTSIAFLMRPNARHSPFLEASQSGQVGEFLASKSVLLANSRLRGKIQQGAVSDWMSMVDASLGLRASCLGYVGKTSTGAVCESRFRDPGSRAE
jgi:hypothetical protein